MTPWRAAALAGALLFGACSKAPAPAPAPTPQAQPQAAAAPAAPATEQEPQAAAPSEEPAAAPEEDKGPPPEFKIGQSRDEVMQRFGNCAVRRVFEPAGPGSLYVEIYQPKDDEHCRKRLGERQFTIRGGSLYQITPGLIPPEPPRAAPTEG
ncbi:MAG: hypothetical protein ACJ8AT_18595 [Hyalangium sp.]|uniref:hypothetical protein n=1 Tax=Hyalangium sp. TaxID=2028555 RepID=UPI00389AC034